jgi:hypothetical protein
MLLHEFVLENTISWSNTGKIWKWDCYDVMNLNHTTYEANHLMVYTVHEFGLGFAGLHKFCNIMGMTELHEETYHKLLAHVGKEFFMAAHHVLTGWANIVHEAQCTQVEETTDIEVSYDGSWQRRGTHITSWA